MSPHTLLAIFAPVALGLLSACGRGNVESLEPTVAACKTYQQCFTLGATPEGCCPIPETGGWACFNFQSDKLHCGDCETSCSGMCCAGECSAGECR